MTPPWLLIAFAGGVVLGVAMTISMVYVLITETPMRFDKPEEDSDWKY